MSRVLLLATTTGYQTRAFGEAAERLGVELVFATDRCNVLDDPWWDAAIPIRFHEPRKSVSAIVAAARSRPIDGILVVGDRPTIIAAEAAAALGLPGHSPAAAAVARDKRRTRERLRAAGLPVPWFRPVPIAGDLDDLIPALSFPCVLKPVALSASRGVMRANDENELRAAFDRLRRLLLAPDVRAERTRLHDTALIEGFIDGREYAVEGILHRGALHVIAIFDKPDPLDGPYFEETIYLTPSRASAAEQLAIARAIADAAGVIGLSHGPVHAECRVNERGVFVLEVAARPIGGLCARVLRLEKRPPENGNENGDGMNFDAQGERFSEQNTVLESEINNLQGRNASRPHFCPQDESIVEQNSAIEDPINKLPPRNPTRPHFGGPTPYEEFLLRHALGEAPAGWRREVLAAGVMMIPIPGRGIYRDVSGVDDARAVPGVEDVRITAKPDQLLVPLPEGASYLGFIFARANSPAEVDRALRDAHARLRFTVDPELRVLQSVHG